MPRCLLVLIVAFVSVFYANGQRLISINDSITWFITQQSDWNSTEETQYPSFNKAYFDLESGLSLKYVKKIPLPGPGKVNCEINPLKYSKLQWLQNNNNISSLDDNLVTEVVEESGKHFVFVSFIPVKNNGGNYELISKFQINLSYEPSFTINKRNTPFKNSSVLKDGDIYKLAVHKTGVYKITYELLTQTLNIPSSQINTNNIIIYGNRGGLLPEPNFENRIDDLEEISYSLIGGEDNSFNPGDYIIFYAEGPDTYKIKSGNLVYEKNIYDDNNYIFLKIASESRSIIPSVESGTIVHPFTYYTDALRYEKDKTNLLGAFGSAQGSGKRWFGDVFSITRSREYSDEFNLSGVLEDKEATITMAFAGRSSSSSNIQLIVDNQSFSKNISSVNISNIEARYARIVNVEAELSTLKKNSTIEVNYPRQGDSEGWLDYIEIKCAKNLNYDGSPLIFQNEESVHETTSSYTISGLNNGMVWDISNPFSIKAYQPDDESSDFTFTHNHNGQLKRYIGFRPNDVADAPIFIEKIDNQNLHSINEADMVIIHPKEFSEAATNLKNHRNSQGFNVLTVKIDEIYNEYAGGKKDPVAIRDFSKMMYERDANYRYLLLLGDGSYDYKNTVPGLPDQNFIPVYETNESLHPIESFPSDDFYALLSNFEGDDLRGQLEIAVGRIPAKSQEEALSVINKIIKYETDKNTLGDWRLRIGFTADDEDSNTHFNQAERISKKTKGKYPLFNQQKVYFDAYNQESTPGGARYPDASKAINENIFKGQLVLNYLGHGGPRGWAQERVLKVNDILSWENEDKMPLIITATCSFTGYDDPGLISAGEYAILKENGGAIGLMTTVRAVYSLENERLTASVYDTIFSSSNNIDLTIGEVIQRAKNNNWQDTTRINARKFALIGDPSMKLSLPRNRIVTTHINGQPVGVSADTIGALKKVIINGIITDRNGNKLNNYRGTIYPTVYDKESELATLRNDSRSRVSKFNLYKSILFKGAATIENGEFSFEFIVPLDIDYRIGQGRVSYYAESSDLSSDGGGYYNDIIIGGSSDGNITDDKGPDINIFMNDERFVYGGTTHANPVLLVKLSDENGINVTGNSIGHDLVAVLDGNNQNAFLLNDFYEASVDDFKSGVVKFPLNELEPGRHTISVKAWDVANNSSEQILEFIVVDEGAPAINNVYNYPNPFSTNTSFMFEHTMQGGELDILIYIYTLSGKLVKTIQQVKINTGTRVNDIQWNGRDEFDDKLGKGIYLYKIKLKDREFNVTEESIYQKLVIIN